MGRTVVVNVHTNEYDVYIGRIPSFGNPKFGNPFVVGVHGKRGECIQLHREWIQTQPELLQAIKSELKGKRIGCHCKPRACHGDTLAWIADEDDFFS
jgi:hypothetical protein